MKKIGYIFFLTFVFGSGFIIGSFKPFGEIFKETKSQNVSYEELLKEDQERLQYYLLHTRHSDCNICYDDRRFYTMNGLRWERILPSPSIVRGSSE